MAVILTAALVSARVPQPVQLVLNGMTLGNTYVVTGTTTDGTTWSIPGGTGTSDGTQLVLTDNRAAFNTPVTYQAIVAGAAYTSSPITIPFSGYSALQSLDGTLLASVTIASTAIPRQGGTRVAVFRVAGRRAPATRVDLSVTDSWSWAMYADGSNAPLVKAILDTGTPAVLRSVLGLADLPPVLLLQPTGWSSQLVSPIALLRLYQIDAIEIEDPQPMTPLSAFTWDDFDTAMAAYDWTWYASFESGTTGWSVGGGSTVPTLANPASGGYSGVAYAWLTAQAAGATYWLAESPGQACSVGTVWSASAYVKGVAGRTAYIQINWTGGGTSAGAAATLTGSWQEVTVTAAAPAGTTAAKVAVIGGASGTLVGDTLGIDAISSGARSSAPVATFDDAFATLAWDQFDTQDWSLI